MSYCYDFIKKFKREGNFCGLDKSEVSRLEAYIEIVDMLMKQHRGFDEKKVIENFPLGAARHLIPIKDERRAKGLDYVAHQLENGKHISGKDIQAKLEISNNKPQDKSRSEKEPKKDQVVDANKMVQKPVGGFENAHDGEPVDPPKTVAQIDQEQVRRQEIAEAAKNQPSFTTAAELPAAEPETPAIPEWSISMCREGKCPDSKRHVFKDSVRGQCCDAAGIPLNQVTRCPIIDRMKKPYQEDGLGNKLIKPAGIRIVKTPLTCEELNRCVDDLIERSGFFTVKEVGMVDELVRAHYENIHSRADFLKKAENWFLTSAGEGE